MRAAALMIAVAALAAIPALAAEKAGVGLGFGKDDSGKPVHVEADQGIEWQQNNRVYIARGNAKATRGQTTVSGDTLVAYYRPACGAGPAKKPGEEAGQAAQKRDPACDKVATDKKTKSAAEREGSSSDPINGESTQIFRMEAIGNVRIATETQTVYGDHAVYDLDQSLVVVTGKNLKMIAEKDTVTARDSFEWYEEKQLAVARGDAVVVREGKRVRADVLTAEIERPPNEAAHINRVDAGGNVLVSSADQIARGDNGVYNLDTGIVTLSGNVTLTKGDNVLHGNYGVVDLNNNVSRLLPAPPAGVAKGSAGPAGPVTGFLVPEKKPGEAKDAKDAKDPKKATTR